MNLDLTVPNDTKMEEVEASLKKLQSYWNAMFFKKKAVKVLFAIPNEGSTQYLAYTNHMDFCLHLGALGVASHVGIDDVSGHKFDVPKDEEFFFFHVSVGRVLTPYAREKMAEYAVNYGFDYLFFLDDDMIVPLDLFERLYKHQVDIVSALAFTRHPPHKPVLYVVKSEYDTVSHRSGFSNHSIFNYPKDQLVECDSVGFGSVLIHTRVLKGMDMPYFMSTTGSGEDLWFCWNAKKKGFKVFCDTATKIGHLGTAPVITEENYEKLNDMENLRKVYPEIPRPRTPEEMRI